MAPEARRLVINVRIAAGQEAKLDLPPEVVTLANPPVIAMYAKCNDLGIWSLLLHGRMSVQIRESEKTAGIMVNGGFQGYTDSMDFRLVVLY